MDIELEINRKSLREQNGFTSTASYKGKTIENVTVTAPPIKKEKDITTSSTIDTLKYKFDQGARTNRYAVNLFCNKLNINMDGIRCINATLPGKQLETSEVSEYGPARKMPYNVSMDGGEVSFTFLCDSSFADRFLIEAWQGFIFGQDDLTNSDRLKNPQFSYYNDYIGQVQIQQLNQNGKPSLIYTLEDAYPVSFSAQELSYETMDDIMKFESTFSFRAFTTDYKNTQSLSGLNRGARAISIFNDLLGLAGKQPNKKITKFAERLNRISGIFD